MVPLIVLLVSFILFRLPGFSGTLFCGLAARDSRWSGRMFVLRPLRIGESAVPDLVRMAPRGLGSAEMWVTVTGIAELLIAAGLQVPLLRCPQPAAAGLMLICNLSRQICKGCQRKADHWRTTCANADSAPCNPTVFLAAPAGRSVALIG